MLLAEADDAKCGCVDRPLHAPHTQAFGVVGIIDSTYRARDLEHRPVMSVHADALDDGSLRARRRMHSGKMVVQRAHGVKQCTGLVPE